MNIHKVLRRSYSQPPELHSAYTYNRLNTTQLIQLHQLFSRRTLGNHMLELLFAPSVPSLPVTRLHLYASFSVHPLVVSSKGCPAMLQGMLQKNSNIARLRNCKNLSVITLCCTMLAPSYSGIDLNHYQPGCQASHRLRLAMPKDHAPGMCSIWIPA